MRPTRQARQRWPEGLAAARDNDQRAVARAAQDALDVVANLLRVEGAA